MHLSIYAILLFLFLCGFFFFIIRFCFGCSTTATAVFSSCFLLLLTFVAAVLQAAALCVSFCYFVVVAFFTCSYFHINALYLQTLYTRQLFLLLLLRGVIIG